MFGRLAQPFRAAIQNCHRDAAKTQLVKTAEELVRAYLRHAVSAAEAISASQMQNGYSDDAPPRRGEYI